MTLNAYLYRGVRLHIYKGGGNWVHTWLRRAWVILSSIRRFANLGRKHSQ